MVTCLGIESTAHTFGAAIIKENVVVSNIRKSVTTQQGGMIPYEIAQHHVANCQQVVAQALQSAGVHWDDVDVISFSQSPGIGHALRIGAVVARTLSVLHDIALVGVNHCIAHLEIGFMLTEATDPILCYASGANTQIIGYNQGRYRVFGETLDIGIGNLLDSVARYMGLGFPGGPLISALAEQSSTFVQLPYTVKGMDVSFGGLETFCRKLIDDGVDHATIAFSLQETIFAMLVEVTERALAHCEKQEVLLGGGVACNTRLQSMMQSMCEQRGAKCFVLANEFNVDNAAMIAWNGVQQFVSGTTLSPDIATIDPYLRTDQVAVTWK